MRGVEVEIVLPQKSDHLFMEWAMTGHLRFFKHIAANVHLSPPPFDHSKLMTVDGEWSLIGSSNWDARSFRLNFEYDLECYQTDLTDRLDAIIDDKIARGREAELCRIGIPARPYSTSRRRRPAFDAISLACHQGLGGQTMLTA